MISGIYSTCILVLRLTNVIVMLHIPAGAHNSLGHSAVSGDCIDQSSSQSNLGGTGHLVFSHIHIQVLQAFSCSINYSWVLWWVLYSHL